MDPIMLRKIAAVQGTQSISSASGSKKASQSQQAGAGSLMDRLNGLDNQLNQGGGVSLNGVQNNKKSKRLWT